MTPESLRAQVNVLLDAEKRMLEVDLPKQAAFVRREAEKLRRAAQTIGIAIEDIHNLDVAADLTSDADSTTLRNVIANSSGKLARGISRSRSKKHPWVRALYDNPDPKKRMTVTDWAKKNGYKPGTAATWVKDPKSDGARRIPRDAVEKIRKQYGLGDEAWAVGITEPE